MATVAVFQGPGLTQTNYEAVLTKMMGKTRPESPGDWPVAGLLAHIAGEGQNGFRVIDVWESDEAFGRFGETLTPMLKEVGIDVQPEMYPAHVFVTG
jgi:hypothetical protein